jgi:hypothetical protein
VEIVLTAPQGITAVLGGAGGNWDELARASQIAPVRYLVAVNDAAMHYPGQLDAFVTLHPEKLSGWLGARRTAGLPEPAAVIAHTAHALVTEVVGYQWPGMTGSGSSGLFATKIALERTTLPVVLCGVPMNASGAHFFCDAPWSEVEQFRAAWEWALPRLGLVRSMSGWTAELLGQFNGDC